jgi:hypothetical protein
MRWFRSNRSLGGYLALFALGLQFVVSFAHIHPEDLGSSVNIGFSSRLTTGQKSIEADGSSTTAPDDHDNGLPHNDCPICTSLQIAASALISPPPVISVPTVLWSVLLQPIKEFRIQLARYCSFRTRAPPIG